MSESSTVQSTLSPEYFQGRLEEALKFADQNQRYEELVTDPTFSEPDLEDFRALARDALHQEQLDTREELLVRDNEPYAQLNHVYQERSDELKDAEHRLVALTDEEDARKTRLLSAAHRAIELAPYAENAATSLARERIAAIEHLDRSGLQKRIGELTTEVAQLDESILVAGQAWPMPEVIRDYDLAFGELSGEDIIIEDEIPVEPETHEVPNDTLQRLIETHGRTHGASIMLTANFVDNPDVIFTPQQLGEFLYTDPSHFEGMTLEERDRCISQRIHRLLNQHDLVKPMLEQEGYVLQYGYRHFINSKSGKPVQRKRRIYRAVNLADNPDAESTFTQVVHPDIEDVSLPTVVRRQTPNKSSAALPIEELDCPADDSLLTEVRKTVQLLWANKLLPDQADGLLSPRELHKNISQFGRNRKVIKSKLPALRKLITSTNASAQLDATEVVLACLSKSQLAELGGDGNVMRRVMSFVTSTLEEFYDSLSV